MYNVAIIGAGYSGNLVLANLVGKLNKPAKILIADNSIFTYKGPPYSTERMEHLLNVRAKNMGAFASDIGHFYSWLKATGFKYTENDFVPRKIYGDYLESIKQKTFSEAAAKNIQIDFLKGRAVRTENTGVKNMIHFDNGNVIECEKLVLATGNQLARSADKVVTEPWFYNFSTFTKYLSDKPIVIIGTGLTAVDTILSIFRSGYQGKVCCVSRKNLFPLPHTKPGVDVKFDISMHIDSILLARPSKILRILKKLVRNNKNYPWQSVFDSIRPYHQKIWQELSVWDQKRILSKYFTLWGIHRHRMAPEILQEVQELLQSGRLNLVAAEYKGYEMGKINIVHSKTKQADEMLTDHIFDCRGLSLRVIDEIFNSVEGLRYAENGYGVDCDDSFAINSNKEAPVFAIGSCLVGQLFESIAVPELRQQAETIAASIANML